jgi:1,4-dihydroxy-2-naphthoyl-CoA hydrolase
MTDSKAQPEAHSTNNEEGVKAEFGFFKKNPLFQFLGIEILEATKEHVIATMLVGPNNHQPYGFLHGGISVVLAETVGSIGSIFHIDPLTQIAFGLEVNANHLRSVRDGLLTAKGVPIHIGRSTHIWDIRITDSSQRMICISRLTVSVVTRPDYVITAIEQGK